MLKFLGEYWRWIVIPMVLVLGAIGLLLVLAGGGDSPSPQVYNVF